MKKIITALIVLLIIIAGFLYYYRYKHTPYVPIQFPSTNTTSSSNIQTKTLAESDPQGYYSVSAAYPVISGLSSVSVQNTINNDIQSAIQTQIDTFKENQVDAVRIQGDSSSLNVSFVASKPTSIPNIITFTVTAESYTSGAAHPGTEITAYTYDLSTGKRVHPSDMFTGSYLQVLSNISNKKIVALNVSDQDQITSGTAPTADNFSVLVPKDDGLHVIFNEYQVAAYAAGPQEIVIPYSDLSSVINPSGPLVSVK